MTLDGSNGVTFNDASLQGAAASPYVLKNRIINGDMRIDQRNAGASVTPTADSTYTLDRWFARLSVASKYSVQQNAGSVTPPVGYTSYLGVTSLSAYTVGASEFFSITQAIEGLNVADLGFGTANAQTVTLSFWVRSSLTGTFGGTVFNNGTRFYPFTYSIPTANTWTQISITIAGDTAGTWLTTNGVGLQVVFSLGAGATVSGTAGAWGSTLYRSATGATSVVGTNGATFYITGVQLEIGTSATPFERRLYNQELANCQRYYYRIVSEAGFGRFGNAYNQLTTNAKGIVQFPVTMRTIPSALEQSGTAANYAVITNVVTNLTVVPALASNGTNSNMGIVDFGVASGLTAGQGSQITSASGVTTAYLGWSAEL
jgi:hypothetical protein